jgi:formylglycine-generating enzyme required for sulfatase activity
MVLVPVGSFQMGSAAAGDEQPVHTQTFTEPFWIDRMEVTRGQYALCVQAGMCSETPASEYSTRAAQPINRVTWFQAYAYCAWRGMRLPEEREWEYAARGVENWTYPWGNEQPNVNLAVYGQQDVTADVGSKPDGASWVGALDMSGNVWEWGSSLYMPYSAEADPGREASPDGNGSGARVLRGGSFELDASYLYSARRGLNLPAAEFDLNGFRCARSA